MSTPRTDALCGTKAVTHYGAENAFIVMKEHAIRLETELTAAIAAKEQAEQELADQREQTTKRASELTICRQERDEARKALLAEQRRTARLERFICTISHHNSENVGNCIDAYEKMQSIASEALEWIDEQEAEDEAARKEAL